MEGASRQRLTTMEGAGRQGLTAVEGASRQGLATMEGASRQGLTAVEGASRENQRRNAIRHTDLSFFVGREENGRIRGTRETERTGISHMHTS